MQRRTRSAQDSEATGPKPTAWRSVIRPEPRSQYLGEAWAALLSAVPAAAAAGISRNKVCATANSPCPLSRDSRSIACRVASWVSSRSARNAGMVCMRCISTLLPAIRPRQSVSPSWRNDVMARPTLRLSATSSSCCWVWAPTGSGSALASAARIASRLRASWSVRAPESECRRCITCSAKACPTPRARMRSTNGAASIGSGPWIRSHHRLAHSRAASVAATRSARRRRFSINTTRKVVGSAHSSPRLSSRACWKPARNSTSSASSKDESVCATKAQARL